MPRPPGVWRRGKNGPWYTTVDGSQVKVADPDATRSKAREELDRLLASRGKGSGLTVRDVANLFLTAVKQAIGRGERAAHTYDGYRRHLGSAVKAFGSVKADDLKPLHVSRWIDGTPWGPTTRNGAITAVKAAMNWARREGYLAANPIADMARPAAKRRRAVLTEEQADQVIETIPDQEFQDLLIALRETGARPGEVAALTASGVDLAGGTWTVPNKTRARTGEQLRKIQLTPPLIEMSRRLVAQHPDGPIFRNRRGNPWTRHAMACRMADLRTRLGMGPELSPYAFRHLFATSALRRKVPIATTATLLGHKDTNMVSKVYSHLDREEDHLREAVRQARGYDPDPSPK